jgi:hypothetical protein
MEHYQYVDDLPIQNKAAGSPEQKSRTLSCSVAMLDYNFYITIRSYDIH